MCAFVRPWFADIDANLLAVGAIIIIGLLIWEVVRELRKKRKLNQAQAARTRSRKDHWGYS
jgi:hypothetical protein